VTYRLKSTTERIKTMTMKRRKVIIAPDSFKGTLTAKEATDIIADEVSAAFPECSIIKMPIADGGEGSVDAIVSAIGGEIITASVQSPDNRLIEAYFAIADNDADGTAILEMAQSSGITKQLGLNPMSSSTYGFGQLILAALDRGARKFKLCIGGSATTDGGSGMAAALGVKFLDKSGNCFVPCGETLCDISEIDTSGIDKRIADSEFTIMCDVENPLFGENGAAYIYGPQKGASKEQIIILDAGLRRYGTALQAQLGKNLDTIPGAGAAGGLGAGCIAFLGAKLQSGIDAILELYSFTEHISDTDLIITGEGKLDSQSFQGKVISGILRNAEAVPVWSICGICDCDSEFLRKKNVTAFETSEGITIEESLKAPAKHLKRTAQKALQKIHA